MMKQGVAWRSAPDQPIVNLREAAASVENGLLTLRLGSEDNPLVLFQERLSADPRSAEGTERTLTHTQLTEALASEEIMDWLALVREVIPGRGKRRSLARPFAEEMAEALFRRIYS